MIHIYTNTHLTFLTLKKRVLGWRSTIQLNCEELTLEAARFFRLTPFVRLGKAPRKKKVLMSDDTFNFVFVVSSFIFLKRFAYVLFI